MTQSRQKKAVEVQPTRRGFPVYKSNPSLSDPFPVRIRSTKPSKGGDAYMIAPGTGEVIAKGAFAFVEEKEVDSEQFVKMYLAGIRRYGELSKAGALMFEFVYREISGRGGKDKDTVSISYLLAIEWEPKLTARTYQRGLGELLSKGFLFRSLAADVYFVNVRFMFNGDRLAFVKAYHLKGGNGKQRKLPATMGDK